MKRIGRILTSRLVLVGLAIILQLAWFFFFMERLTSYSVFINGFFRVASIFVLLYLIRKDESSAYKIAWIILVMGLPLFGGILYLLIGNKKPSKNLAVHMAEVKGEMSEELVQNEQILKEIEEHAPDVAGNIRYLGEYGPYPVWKNTQVKYYPVGEAMFADMLRDLEKAEHYIFLEYYIIEEGIMWNTMLEILERKVREGVDVRLIYDDVGCVSKLPYQYAQRMKEKGIKWVFIGGVDNALLKMADTILLGMAIDKKVQIASKSIVKANPHERVGVFAKMNGHPKVIEYSEMPEKMAEEVDSDGELKYGEAHIMCNLYTIEAIEKISKETLIYHSAFKKNSYIDENGKEVIPQEENSYKFESFIFDAFELFDDIAILRGKREDDFAPVKNKEGVDSPKTAKELYEKFWNR